MTAGNDTIIHTMMNLAGFINLFEDKTRYPQISLEEIIERKPNYILLSTEPFPFKERHIKEFEDKTGIKTILVDGTIFSWFGSRLTKFNHYVEKLEL